MSASSLAALAVAGGVVAGVTTAASPAVGATAKAPHGYVARAFQYRDRSMTVNGFGYDRNHPRRHPLVCVAVGGRCVRYVRPALRSPGFNRSRHIAGTGGHRFSVRIGPVRSGAVVRLWGYRGAGVDFLDAQRANTPGHRVVHIARRFVGGNYTYGGSSPRTGFDCSGYTMYSYAHGRTARLPHNADAQRRLRSMHRIARRAARPGDLIFYMSGSSAVHVAIFAGRGYQYSATNERQGIRYQRIYSRNVVFKSDWHRG